MSWEHAIMNKSKQIFNGGVEIIRDFPNNENFGKSNYRKAWVTSIFIDIVGYSEICKKENDKTVGKMIRTFHEGILAIFEKYDIKNIDIQGDGIFGVVHSPKQNDKNDKKIMDVAMNIQGFLKYFWRLANYKISIASKEELMIVVGSQENKKIVFAGGAVNEAKHQMDYCTYNNIIIANKSFVEENEKNLISNDNRHYFVKEYNNIYTSNWYFTIWAKYTLNN